MAAGHEGVFLSLSLLALPFAILFVILRIFLPADRPGATARSHISTVAVTEPNLTALGNVRTQTLQAFTDQEFDAIVK